ncbi:MAG: molybdopterin-dependent oxidoreductase [Anaerolineales bacterium]|nr:molybdopterin-dependent oxidoreductase [Anaerolineales bacterium]
MTNPEQTNAKASFTRRDFLKISGIAGGTLAVLGNLPQGREAIRQAFNLGENTEFFEAKPENQIYSVCLQCNTGCGIKVKLYEGLAAKIDGNPYSPWTLWPHIPYQTPISEAATSEGALCPKGQSGIQTAYDPYRLVSVLKRKPGTKRGEGQWETISFEQALDEIVNGGDLFGEGKVEGLKDLYAVRDPELMKQMGAAIKAIWDEKDAEKKKELLKKFQEDFKDHLDKLIDPQHPDLGPKNNQLAFVWGRMKNGRGDLVRRFFDQGFGTLNYNGHTTVCQGSLYFTGKQMSSRWNPQTGQFDSGDKFYWQADTGNSEFVIYAGANLYDANYGPPQRVPKATQASIDGRKFAVIDPRLSKLAARAWKWVPIKPGTDAAFALGMIRWIFENERYNQEYLAIANQAAASAAGEPNCSNAAWLVKVKDGKPTTFLRASEIGLVEAQKETDKEGKEVTVYVAKDGTKFTCDVPVILMDGKPFAFDPVDPEAAPAVGEILVDTKVGEFAVKSSLQILKEEAEKHTLDEWAKICDVKVEDIILLAYEFTSHGRKAVIDIHRGPSQHTNGFYANNAYYALNLLIGNFDYAGGTVKGTTYNRLGEKAGQPFPLGKMIKNALTPFGIDILRTKVAYEKTTLFNKEKPYPTKRPWFPIASDIYQEDVPSMGDAYPYQIKVFIQYMNGMAYSLPAAQTVIDILADPKKIPLIIASDILIGETSAYADYVFPDLSYLERWEFHGTHPSVVWKVEGIRQPAISLPNWPTVNVFGAAIPLSFEALLLGIAEKLNLPGFGKDAFGEGLSYIYPEDFYLKMAANVAFGEKEDGSDAVPEADDEELRIFREARRFLPSSVFDEKRWKAAVGNDESLWRRVVYVLNRGGRYQDFAKAYKGSQVTNKYGRLINLYHEKTYKSINTMTGEHMFGCATYVPAGLDYMDQEIKDEGYDLHLITYKTITMTKARTITNYWLLAVMPEGYVVINSEDARKRGIKHGDRVRLSSASNPEGLWDVKHGRKIPIVGKAYVTEGIRPGVVAFPLGFGHWASGSSDIIIDGQVVKGDTRRAVPLHANAVMRVDPVTKNVTLSDLVGGSAVFYDTKVKVEKA